MVLKHASLYAKYDSVKCVFSTGLERLNLLIDDSESQSNLLKINAYDEFVA